MTEITIPREALEAGRKAFANAGTAEDDRDPFAEACLAMLKEWPGAFQTTTQINRDATEVLILPLTQE